MDAMNQFDDVIAEALASILRLELDLTGHVHASPPESVDDLPAAIIVETDGDTQRSAYAGQWEATITARLLVLLALRGKDGVEKAVTKARPWVGKILLLFSTHDELAAANDSDVLGEIKAMRWKVRNINYAGVDFSGIEFFVEMRVDWQMCYGSGPVGTLPA